MNTTRKSRIRAVVALALGLSVALTGCQTGGASQSDLGDEAVDLPPLTSLTPLEDPRAYEGPSTAVVGPPSIEPLAEKPEAQLPVTVQSQDRTGEIAVEVTDTSRVLAVSLTGTLSDIVYNLGLGDQLIGRDATTSFPGSEELPLVVTGGHDIEAESILGLEPSVIFTDLSVGGVDFVNMMRNANVPVIVVQRSVNLESSSEATRQVAAGLGVADAAEKLNENVAAAVAAKEAEVAELVPADASKLPRVAFLYVRGGAGVYYLFGEGSGIDELLASVGVVDVADEVGWKGERPMTDEALVSMDPDIIIVMSKGLTSTDGIDGLIEAQPSVALTTAGKNRRIIDIDDTLLFASAGRTPDVIDALARAIYAPDSLQ